MIAHLDGSSRNIDKAPALSTTDILGPTNDYICNFPTSLRAAYSNLGWAVRLHLAFSAGVAIGRA